MSDQIMNSLAVSVVLPIFEEAIIIQTLIPDIVQTLEEEGISFEIIAVDDGSNDDTAQILRQLKVDYPHVLRVVRHVYNKGNGAALRTGTRVARGEVVLYMDSDGQHLPSEIPKVLSKIPPYDLVIGSRTKDYRGGWMRKFANGFYNKFATWLTSTQISDLTSGFRALRRSVADHFLHLYPSGFSAPTTITLTCLKAGYNVAFTPVHVEPRKAGKSKIRIWNDGSRFVIIILRMIILYDPLRIFLPVGIVLSILGIWAWLAGLLQAQRLVLPNSAIFLFIAAILTWLLGLISGQIANSRIYYHGDETIMVDDLAYDSEDSEREVEK